ncbi:hypothetical protein ACFXHD_38375 [Streptomyces hydrogenans]|uniref:hypothetical protein n=1 Tax=Streptomyces hydrogenans TaxID=1873719 RepID=UPI0036C8802A
MSTDQSGKSFFPDPSEALRQVAQTPAAYGHYLADFQRVLLDMQAKLEILQQETQVHCRNTRVKGDKWGQARLRSYPVEKSLNDVLKNLQRVCAGLEKSAHKRHAHDEKVAETKRQRKANAELKARRNSATLPPAPENPARQGAQAPGNSYAAHPETIYDLGRRESA